MRGAKRPTVSIWWTCEYWWEHIVPHVCLKIIHFFFLTLGVRVKAWLLAEQVCFFFFLMLTKHACHSRSNGLVIISSRLQNTCAIEMSSSYIIYRTCKTSLMNYLIATPNGMISSKVRGEKGHCFNPINCFYPGYRTTF